MPTKKERNGRKRITIKDIAERCGVTANTVSRVLRGDEGISEATAGKIREAAAQMGYVRNNFASTMRSGKSRLISVIVDDIQNPHYATLVNRIDSILKEKGYDVMTLCTQGDREKSFNMANLSISNLVDGTLYFPDSDEAYIAELFRKNNVPVIMIDRVIPGVQADVVRADDYQGGEVAAEYLLSAGHKKFAYIGGPGGNGAQPLRQKGFTDTLLRHGIQERDIRVIDGGSIYPVLNSLKLFEVLQPLDYTGVFVFNDQIAYHVMNVLRSNGYNIPQDISIIGFDHIRGSLSYLLPLTSLACDQKTDLAEHAVSLLLRRIEEPAIPFISEVLPVKLYEPESTVKRAKDN